VDPASNDIETPGAPRAPRMSCGGRRDEPERWAGMTKGECLLLALTLHRLRQQADRRRAAEEEGT
jgi:hypothetical protein